MFKSLSYIPFVSEKWNSDFVMKFNEKLIEGDVKEVIYKWSIWDRQYTYGNKYALKNVVATLKYFKADSDLINALKEETEEFKSLEKEIVKFNDKFKEQKKEYNKSHKKEIEQEKVDFKEQFGYAIVNDEKIGVSIPMTETSNPLIVRGDDERMWCWKLHTPISKVVVNCVKSDETKHELERMGFQVVSKKDVDWIFSYKIDLVGAKDYPSINKSSRLCANSSNQIENVKEKYEHSYQLIQKFKDFDSLIDEYLNSDSRHKKEVALAIFLIKNYAIRVGNERNEWQADTVGITTLRKEHIKIENNKLILDFLAKDSIPYHKEDIIDERIAREFENLLKDKSSKTEIFRLNSSELNSIIKDICPSASPKTFRSAKCCATFCEEFNRQNVKSSWKDNEKKKALIKANLVVAEMLNHKKGVSGKSKEILDNAMTKLDDNIKDKKQKYDTFMKEYTQKKKIINMNLKDAKNRKSDILIAKYTKQKNDLELKKQKLEENVLLAKDKKEIKKDTSKANLTTSLNSYCSPQVIYSICKDMDYDVKNIYTKTMMNKFSWAEDTGKNYWKKWLGWV